MIIQTNLAMENCLRLACLLKGKLTDEALDEKKQRSSDERRNSEETGRNWMLEETGKTEGRNSWEKQDKLRTNSWRTNRTKAVLAGLLVKSLTTPCIGAGFEIDLEARPRCYRSRKDTRPKLLDILQ